MDEVMAGKVGRSRSLQHLAVLVVFCAVFRQAQAVCPPGWMYFSEVHLCYDFNSNGQFDDAKKYCETRGGYLAKTLTDTVLQYVNSTIITESASVKFWVGMEDKGTGEGFQLLDGQDVPTSAPWKDDTKPPPSSFRKCGILQDSVLSSEDCHQDQVTALCEHQLDTARCPIGWYPIGRDCMKLSKVKKPWDAASADCKAMNAEPMRITSYTHANKMKHYLNMPLVPGEYEFWTGAAESKGESRWADGSKVESMASFKIMNEETDDKKDKCGFIFSSTTETVLNITSDCQVHRSYACFLADGSPDPKPLDPVNLKVCSERFNIVGDTCYYKSKNDYRWTDAKSLCEAKGAKLFVASTSDEEFNLLDILDNDYYWVGMSKDGDGEPLKWSDGSEFTAGLRNVNGEKNQRNCGVATAGSANVAYYLNHCSAFHRFICQKDQDVDAPLPEVTEAPAIDQGNCGARWEARPGTDVCYSFIEDAVELSMAEDTCVALGGHLASIKDRDEEKYLKGRLESLSEDYYWIGLRQNTLHGWHWFDQSPFAYIHWAAGEGAKGGYRPYSWKSHAYLSKHTMEWGSHDTDQVALPAVCKKHTQEQTSQMFTTPEPKEGQFYECEENWHSFENNCYFVNNQEGTWFDARDVCMEEGADLASIENEEENNFLFGILPKECMDQSLKCDSIEFDGHCKNESFVMAWFCPKTCGFCDANCVDDSTYCRKWAKQGFCGSLTGYNCSRSCGCDGTNQGYWIGLYFQDAPQQFKWLDESVVKQTYWARDEPESYHGSSGCVFLNRITGKWEDEKCFTKSVGFVCRKPKSFKDVKIEDPTSVGCQPGARGHYDMCYTFEKEPKSWYDAKQACEDTDQRLAIISDAQTDAFVTSEVYSNFGYIDAWIGLSYETNGPEWVDGSQPTYTAGFHNGDLEDGKCARAVYDGRWAVWDCTWESYYVCESHRAGYTTALPGVPTSPAPATCPGGWLGFRDRCYRLFSDKKTWADASVACESHGGSLVAVHDQATQDLLWDNLGVKHRDNRPMWIGLHRESSTDGFIWSDDTALTFTKWKVFSAFWRNQYGSNCVAIHTDGEWYKLSCNFARTYACQIYADGLFIPDSTAFVAPVSYCEDGKNWREYNGNCYYSSNYVSADWYAARKDCHSKQADLVSIHSQRENDFIKQLAEEGDLNQYWIGYHELGISSYAWADNTALNYDNFADGEPNDAYGAEKCVNIYVNGLWVDDHCTKKFGYICKKMEGTMPPPTLPTEVKGRCPEGFKSEEHSNKCFYLSPDSDKKTWKSAHKACQAKYAKAELATIHGPIDQAFVTLLIEESKWDTIWIGLNSQDNHHEWVWVDNSINSFTYWGLGRPRPSNMRSYREDCGLLLRKSSDAIGTWSHDYCFLYKPYLCQALRVPSEEEDENPFKEQYGTAKCSDQDSFLYHGRCYRFYDVKKTWEDARTFCKQKNADLALTFDTFEGARLNYESYKDGEHAKFWIGVRFDEDLMEYAWGEDYEVQVTLWDQKEPNQPFNDSCVSFLDGSWYDESCSEEKSFFCVEGDYDEFIPALSDPTDTTCEDPKYKPFGDKCYWVPTSTTASWSDANQMCSEKGMTLTSIHTTEEVAFLTGLLEKTRLDTKNAWIGYRRGPEGSFRWFDESPVNLNYWDVPAEPSSRSWWAQNEECVEMMLDKQGKWNDLACEEKLAFVCSKENVSPTVTPTVVDGPVHSDDDDPQAPAQPVDPSGSDDDPQAPAKPVNPSGSEDDPQAPAKPVDPSGSEDDPQAPAKPVDPSGSKDDPQAPAKPVNPSGSEDDPQAPAKPVDQSGSSDSHFKDDTSGDGGGSKGSAKDDDVGGSDGDSDGGSDADYDDGFDEDVKDAKKTQQSPEGQGHPDGMSGGAIAGTVIGVLAFLALIVALAFFVHRRGSLWRQESILRGNNSSGNAAFDNVLYNQELEDINNDAGL